MKSPFRRVYGQHHRSDYVTLRPPESRDGDTLPDSVFHYRNDGSEASIEVFNSSDDCISEIPLPPFKSCLPPTACVDQSMNHLAVAAHESWIRIYDLRSGECVYRLPKKPPLGVAYMHLSVDGILTYQSDRVKNTIRRIQALDIPGLKRSVNESWVERFPKGTMDRFGFSPDGHYFFHSGLGRTVVQCRTSPRTLRITDKEVLMPPAWGHRILVTAEMGNDLRVIDLSLDKQVLCYSPPRGSHFINFGVGEDDKKLSAIRYEYDPPHRQFLENFKIHRDFIELVSSRPFQPRGSWGIFIDYGRKLVHDRGVDMIDI